MLDVVSVAMPIHRDQVDSLHRGFLLFAIILTCIIHIERLKLRRRLFKGIIDFGVIMSDQIGFIYVNTAFGATS